MATGQRSAGRAHRASGGSTALKCRSGSAFSLEPLESRQLLSTHPGASAPIAAKVTSAHSPTNINLSRMPQNQAEGAIAIDPSNPSRIFAASNLEFDDGLFATYSTNGGVTWSSRTVAGGADGLIPAISDPTVAFDAFGNLYLGYMNANADTAVLALSTDGGRSFRRLASFRGHADQPTVTAARGQVWFTFSYRGHVAAAGAAVMGLAQVGTFTSPAAVPSSGSGNFGDIAIGPRGQVMVTYLAPLDDSPRSDVDVSVNPDGLGPRGFCRPVLAANTNLSGYNAIRAQSRGSIDAEPSIAYDRSGSAAAGRVYLVYAARNMKTKAAFDTNIMLRRSDNDGRTWSAPSTRQRRQDHHKSVPPALGRRPGQRRSGHLLVRLPRRQRCQIRQRRRAVLGRAGAADGRRRQALLQFPDQLRHVTSGDGQEPD